jgi:lysozyme
MEILLPQARQDLTKATQGWEKCRLLPYLDSEGNSTIGWGRCLSTKGVSQAEADLLFSHDLDDALAGVASHVPGYAALNDARKIILADMCFNLGLAGIMGFHNMIKYLARNDFASAGKEMLNSLAAHKEPNRVNWWSTVMVSGAL